jgi:3-hydroxyisobutyrate dehydrogenase
MQIAFLGLGAMGLPMACRLVDAGHGVTGADVSPARLAAFGAKGGRTAAHPAAAAQGAELVIVMTATGDQAEAALFGAEGAAPAAPAGAVVLLMCTQSAVQAQRIAGQLAETGLETLDAPVSGGTVGAEAGTLTIMASGAATAFDRARPVLEVLGRNIFDLGRVVGRGSTAKTINQLLCGVHIVAAAEAMALGAAAGLDLARLQEILKSGAANSWMLGNRGPRMLEEAPEVTSAVDIFVKDLGLVLAAGEASRVPLPIAAAARQMFLAASGMGLGRADDSQVVRVWDRLKPQG